MKRIDTEVEGVCLLEPIVHGDDRGFFTEFYNRKTFAGVGIDATFVQDNHSLSRQGVLRGLHYQLGRPQAKLVRVIRGEIFDVAVDVRAGSPTFGRWMGAKLSAENKRMIFMPAGIAHGFYVLSAVAEFIYKCSDFYAPTEERGIIWSDPDLNIAWPLGGPPLLSEKDGKFGPLRELPGADLPVYECR